MTGADTFPTEILLDIFRKALPHRLDKMDRIAFQAIRSVCARWRSVSFSSPELWSSLSVMCRRQELRVAQLPRLERWFSYTGSSIPLDLEVRFAYKELSYQSIPPADITAIRAFIQRYQHRWRLLCLCIDTACFWEIFLALPSANWTSLQTFYLWMGDADEYPYQQLQEVLANMASLHCLFLEDHNDFWHKARLGPTDVSELHYTFHKVFRSDHQVLISSHPNLTNLTLDASDRYAQALRLTPEDHLTLTSLQKLSYTTDDLSLLDYFTTPALISLKLKFNVPVLKSEETLRQFLKRCTNSLQSINLSDISEASFIEKSLPMLSVRPSITQIILDPCPFATLDAIFNSPTGAWCPNLCELSVSIGIEIGPLGKEYYLERYQSICEEELERLRALAAFLLRRQEQGPLPLERLIVYTRSCDIEFPYEWFEGIDLGELRVMVPW